MGTTVSSMQPGLRSSLEASGSGSLGGAATSARPEFYDQIPRSLWPQQQQQQQPPQITTEITQSGAFSPSGRPVAATTYGPQQALLPPNESKYEPQGHPENTTSTATLVHEQEQRGVSQLQNAVSVAANGTRVRTPLPESPEINQVAGTQSGNSFGGLNSGLLSGGQGGLEKRGPVEFNHAISYVNKIKVSLPSYCSTSGLTQILQTLFTFHIVLGDSFKYLQMPESILVSA